MDALSVPVDSVPATPLEPLQPPEAVQPVALVDVQVRLADADFWTVSGATASETDGGAGTAGPGAGAAVFDGVPPPQPTSIAAAVDHTPRSSVRTENLIKSGSWDNRKQPAKG